MGRTILLERRQSESVGRRNSRTTFLRSDWPRPFARREVGVEMELGRSENKRDAAFEQGTGINFRFLHPLSGIVIGLVLRHG
ncbi:hypothetical protein TNCV_1059511 [Trichonephila clavipes]|nr:hypothetical protein TNCV_1059511 [Trichonephila clavipes]